MKGLPNGTIDFKAYQMKRAAAQLRMQAADALQMIQSGSTILENLIADRTVSEGDDDMALIRRRIVIGYNDDGTEIVKRIQAKDENEANDKTVQAYVDSGRIWEFLDRSMPEEQRKETTKTQFRAYI